MIKPTEKGLSMIVKYLLEISANPTNVRLVRVPAVHSWYHESPHALHRNKQLVGKVKIGTK